MTPIRTGAATGDPEALAGATAGAAGEAEDPGVVGEGGAAAAGIPGT